MTATDRVHGTVSKWNDQRGFGFVTLARGNVEVFVHISAFPPGGARPSVGELVSCRVRTGPDGRQRAIEVMRPGQRRSSSASTVAADRRLGALGLRLLAWAAIGFAAFQAYRGYESRAADSAAPIEDIAVGLAGPASKTPEFKCDGRVHCSQMRSCEEAKYFQAQCPGTKMDGDYDGMPCERDVCGH